VDLDKQPVLTPGRGAGDLRIYACSGIIRIFNPNEFKEKAKRAAPTCRLVLLFPIPGKTLVLVFFMNVDDFATLIITTICANCVGEAHLATIAALSQIDGR
jgi:hypothetical protein